jgi:hypothetical protein
MARGEDTDYQKLVLVMSDWFTTRSYSQVAKDLDMPQSTVFGLVNAHKDDEEFVKLRIEKEKEFAERANHLIFKNMARMDRELDKEDKDIPISQLSTAIGTLFDKKAMAQNGVVGNITPNVQIVMVDNSKLESAMYEEN